jgi:phage shock protein A
MFDDVKQALHDLLHGNVAPGDRREALQEMRDTLVRARMALDDLRAGVRQTEARLRRERTELETVQRRRALAEGVGDAETVSIAQRFEVQHQERVTLLEKRLEVEQGELAMVERDVEEMTTRFKAAQAGVGSGLRSGAADPATADPLAGDAALNAEIDGLGRAQRRATHEAEADARLAELKRRMGL